MSLDKRRDSGKMAAIRVYNRRAWYDVGIPETESACLLVVITTRAFFSQKEEKRGWMDFAKKRPAIDGSELAKSKW